MAGLLQDSRFALRQLRKNPGFTITAIAMLTIAICANSTVLSWINGTMLHPIPGAQRTGALVSVMRGQWSISPPPPFSYLDYRDLRDQNHSFEGILGYHHDWLTLTSTGTIESIGSSTRIEGSHLSDREVERLLANLEIQSFASRDEQEVAGYAAVMENLFNAWRDIPVTENHIKQLHRDLLQYSLKDDRYRGEYKKLPNNVAAFGDDGKQIAIVFETATPFETPRRMAELVEWLHREQELKRLHPLLIIAVFTVVFLAIHPFQDGNGRLSRALTTLLLLKAGYAYVPFSSLESVIENSKEGYYLALRQTQTAIQTDHPNWQPWLTFFLRALQQQKRRLAVKVERERLVLTALPELAVNILEYAREHGRVTMADMIRSTGASRNTLKEHFRKLIEMQQLTMHGSRKGTWYVLK